MKYIFDFDNVIFHTSRSLKERIFDIYDRHGISRARVADYIEREIQNGFSLKKFLEHFGLRKELYEEIMKGSEDFVNHQILNIVKKAGRENCYIVTMGDEEFQKDKIVRAGINKFFNKIIVVLGSKKEAVEKICEANMDEKIVFIDDKESHFKDLDFKKYPNLKTILYTGQKLDLGDFSG